MSRMELPLSRAGVGPRGPESVRLTPVRKVSNARATKGISRLRIYHLLEYGILSMNPLLVYYVSWNCLEKKDMAIITKKKSTENDIEVHFPPRSPEVRAPLRRALCQR